MDPFKTLVLAACLLPLSPGLMAKAAPAPGTPIGALLGIETATAAGADASPAAATALSPSAGITIRPADQDSAQPEPLFTDGQTAVAYQVSEKLFGHEKQVTGRNGTVTVQVEAQGDERRVVVSAAANGFKTERAMRDSRVAGYLGGSKGLVVVRTGWFSAESLTALTQAPSSLPGVLEVKGQPAAVTLTATGDGKTVRVQAVTTFKALGLEPPAMMLMGEVHQPLTLSAQIQLGAVKGFK